jgi:hypothetical protein
MHSMLACKGAVHGDAQRMNCGTGGCVQLDVSTWPIEWVCEKPIFCIQRFPNFSDLVRTGSELDGHKLTFVEPGRTVAFIHVGEDLAAI